MRTRSRLEAAKLAPTFTELAFLLFASWAVSSLFPWIKTGIFSKRPTFRSPSVCREQRFWPLKARLDGEGRGDSRRRSDWSELRENGIHVSAAARGQDQICEHHNVLQLTGTLITTVGSRMLTNKPVDPKLPFRSHD